MIFPFSSDIPFPPRNRWPYSHNPAVPAGREDKGKVERDIIDLSTTPPPKTFPSPVAVRKISIANSKVVLDNDTDRNYCRFGLQMSRTKREHTCSSPYHFAWLISSGAFPAEGFQLRNAIQTAMTTFQVVVLAVVMLAVSVSGPAKGEADHVLRADSSEPNLVDMTCGQLVDWTEKTGRSLRGTLEFLHILWFDGYLRQKKGRS